MTDSLVLKAALRVPLNGYAMQLRPSELEAVAAGLGKFEVANEPNLVALAEAVQQLPVNDRAPAWELAVRHFGRRTPLAQAAGEIGMDVVHAQDLLEVLIGALTSDPTTSQPASTRPPQ